MSTHVYGRIALVARSAGLIALVVLSCMIAATACRSSPETNAPAMQPTKVLPPDVEVTEASYASLQAILELVTARPLYEDPGSRLAGGLLQTRRKPGEGTSDVQFSRQLSKTLDGIQTDFSNAVRLYAWSPGEKGMCRLEFELQFTQNSPLISGVLTADLVLREIEDPAARHSQISEIIVSLEGAPDGGLPGQRSELTMQLVYGAELGAYLAPGRALDSAATDAELRKTTNLVNQATECFEARFKTEASSMTVSGDSINSEQLHRLGICTFACTITGRESFEHPTWGHSTLLTTLIADPSIDREAHVLVIDSSGGTRWRFDGCWQEAALIDRDKTGNLFVQYNPGRYDGFMILRPVADGFHTFETVPKVEGVCSDYRGKFYNSAIAGTDSNGNYEIELEENDCNVSCESGGVPEGQYYWNGSEYALRR